LLIVNVAALKLVDFQLVGLSALCETAMARSMSAKLRRSVIAQDGNDQSPFRRPQQCQMS